MTETTNQLGLPMPMATATEWKLLLNQGLEQLRRERNVTQRALADAASLNVDTIGRIERGTVHGSLKTTTLESLATAFGCASLSEFWRALQNARTGDQNGAELRFDERTRRILFAFQELFPTQQDAVEAIVLWFRANARAHRSGEELISLDGLSVTPRRR